METVWNISFIVVGIVLIVLALLLIDLVNGDEYDND